MPGASVAPVSGLTSATYTGTFELALIDLILVLGDSVQGSSTFDRGNISLTADFNAGTLTGSGTGLDLGSFSLLLNGNQLSVDGTLNGTALSGTVTYDGVTGPLQGLVGSDEAIGAFHGHNDSQLFAGGFIAN